MGLQIASRMSDIHPFYVMDILARARSLEAQGRNIVHMEIGELDFSTPQPVIDAGIRALYEKHTHYTPATGLPGLREQLAAYYLNRYKVTIPVERIIITPGASGALQLALGVLLNAREKVLLADPGYPCNRHFVSLFDGVPQMIPVTAEHDYQLDAQNVAQHWDNTTVAAMVASPSNPTGTLVSKNNMSALFNCLVDRGGCLIVDEIYQGLVYEDAEYSALEFDNANNMFVVNSFSKQFGMTGWRLGWLVVPEKFIQAVDHLAQNIFLAPPTIAQYAALEAFGDATSEILDEQRRELKARRDYLYTALKKLGFVLASRPRGAFYLYVDCKKMCTDSKQFVNDLLEKAGVAITPGADFGSYRASEHVRFAYTRPIEVLREGVRRIEQFITQGGGK